jgi:hypothetical protein
VSRTRVIVGTTTTRVIKDALLPDAVRTGVQEAIVSDGDIVDHVMEGMVGSLGLRMERMFKYGRDHYTYGLPVANISARTQGREEVQAVLEAIEGQPVVMEYCNLAPPNNMHMAWMAIIAGYGYNPNTNELTALSTPTWPAYLDDLIPRFPWDEYPLLEPDALDLWGTSPRAGYTQNRQYTAGGAAVLADFTPPIRSAFVAQQDVLMRYLQPTTPGATRTTAYVAELVVALPPHDNALDYFQVKYTAGGVTKYWMYQAGAGTYPTVDAAAFQPQETFNSFFPWTYFRFNKTQEAADAGNPGYVTAKKMLKMIGMDYDDVSGKINQNPDVTDVEQAMMVVAVPADSQDPLDIRYLFEFFDRLQAVNGSGVTSVTEAQNKERLGGGWWLKAALPRNALILQDGRFKMALTESGIFKQLRAGSVGPIGTHTCTEAKLPIQQDSIDENGVETVGEQLVSQHIYRKQITSGLYEEITVVNLALQYYIFGKYGVTAMDDLPILLVPVDHSITEAYTLKDRERLYGRSLQLVFNSVVIQKIQWYQDTFFEFLMVVVSVFITVASFGSDGGQTLMAALAAGSTAALTSAVLTLLENFLVKLAIGEAIKLFVKAVGGEVALALAVALLAFGGFSSLTGAPFADDLLSVSSSLVKGVNGYYADEIQGIQGQFGELAQEKELLANELERANKLLENSNRLNPFVVFGESPDDFYNRTVHSGNIGIQAIGAISSYVDTALRLPKLADTLGETTYA